MTARHQIRVGNRRLGRDRTTPIDATPAPSVGEMLQAARERKGVDLFRAERDTKIRAKHLAALESDEYGELPGAVYTKGFLRNYAVYLGLDPDDILARWRDEAVVARRPEPAEVVAPPRPLEAPKGGLTFTRGILVAALVSLGILAFVAYVVLQVVRYAQTAPVTIDGPRVRELAADATSIRLTGESAPSATVVVTGSSELRVTAEADARGRWAVEVPLAKGRNDFTVVAQDPITKRDSEPVSLIITVPVPATPTPSARPSGSGALLATSLALTQPAEGARSTDGKVVVAGTTDATTVRVTATRAGAPGSTPAPSAPAGTPAAGDVVTRDVAVPSTRSFTTELSLAPGRWTIAVAATASGRAPATQTRTLEVAYTGVTVTITAREGVAWIRVSLDGRLAPGHRAGATVRKNDSVTFVADRTISVRTGNSGRTHFTVNGEELGTLGRVGAVETWIFEKGKEPRRVQ